jgi:hypothetical protein
MDDTGDDGSFWAQLTWLEASPWSEIVSGTRALGPLVLFLALTMRVFLATPLPQLRVVAKVKLPQRAGSPKQQEGTHPDPVLVPSQSLISVWPGLFLCAPWIRPGWASLRRPHDQPCLPGEWMCAVCVPAAYAGIIVFNIGLRHGLSKIGRDAGAALPAAFKETAEVAGSPLYGYEQGLGIVLAFAFVLGTAATAAEPALAALRGTVQRLTKGAFSPAVSGPLCPFGRPFWLGFTYAPPVLVKKLVEIFGRFDWDLPMRRPFLSRSWSKYWAHNGLG